MASKTSLQELYSYCQQLLEPHLFDDFCPNGLQVEGKAEVRRLAVAVSASLYTIQEAVAAGADLLLVHHGLFWNRQSPLLVGSFKKKVELLLASNLSLLAYHLPLDGHRNYGNNWGAAKEMGWQQLAPFPPKEKRPIGVMGSFAPRPRELLAQELSDYYGHPVEVVFGGKSEVSSAALISGGAHRSIGEAAGLVDCFLTGSRDEPTWHEAKELQLNFFALGHSASEVAGPRLLATHLAERYGLDYQFISEANPF